MSDSSTHSKTHEYRQLVYEKYHTIRRRQIFIWLLTAILSLCAAWCAALLVTAICDYIFMPDAGGQMLLSLVVYFFAAIVCITVMIHEWRKRVAHRVLVNRMEKHMPGIRHGLATFLDRAATSDASEKRFVDELANRVGTLFESTSSRKLVTRKPLIHPSVAFILIVIGFFLWMIIAPYSGTALLHILLPGMSPSYTRVTDTTAQKFVAKGSNMLFSAAITGRPTRKAFVTLSFDNNVSHSIEIPLSNNAVITEMQGITRPFEYHFTAADGKTKPQRIDVVNIPVITTAYADITWPAYTRRGTSRQEWKKLHVISGCSNTFSWFFADPVKNVTISTKEGVYPDISVSGTFCSAHISPEKTTHYILHAEDAESETGEIDIPFEINVHEDSAPKVTLRQPIRDVKIPEDYGFTIEAEIKDDVFIRDISLMYQINDQPMRRIPLYRDQDGDFLNAMVITHRFDMTEVTVRENDFLSLYVAARDIRPGESGEGRSRLLFVETLPATYAQQDDGGGGGPKMLNPFPKFTRIQKQVVADAFTILPQTNTPDKTLSQRDSLSMREELIGDASKKLYEIFITKMTNFGYPIEMVKQHELSHAFRHITKSCTRISTNYINNNLPVAYRQSQQLLAFMLGFKMPESESSGEEQMTEEENILQALRLAEREESKRIEDERKRRLARLDELEEELEKLQKKQREIAQNMSKSGEESKGKKGEKGEGKSSSGSSEQAKRNAEEAAQMAEQLAQKNGESKSQLDKIKNELKKVSDLLAQGKEEEARKALEAAMSQTDSVMRKTMKKRNEEIADALGSLGQQIGMLAEYQDSVRKQTTQRIGESGRQKGSNGKAGQQKSSIDTHDLAADQKTAEEWWKELQAHAHNLMRQMSGLLPVQQDALLKMTRKMSAAPVSDEMQTAQKALANNTPAYAIPAQSNAYTQLQTLAEFAHKQQNELAGNPLENLEKAAREFAQLEKQQKTLAERFASGKNLPGEFEKDFLIQKQQDIIHRMQASRALISQGAAAALFQDMSKASASAQHSLGMLEGQEHNPTIHSSLAKTEREIRDVYKKLQKELHKSAVARLQRLRREAIIWADSISSNAFPALFDTELTSLRKALKNHDVEYRLEATQNSWKAMRTQNPRKALLHLADECTRACAVIEVPKIARVENFIHTALRDRKTGTNYTLTVRTAHAAVNCVVDTSHTRSLTHMLGNPDTFTSNPATQQKLRDEINALKPIADAWLRALVTQQREMLKTDEKCPPEYTDIVNEYLRILSYK